MRESINRGCAWAMVVLGTLALLFGLAALVMGRAANIKIPVLAFWALILFLGVYVLFFKTPKEKPPHVSR